MYSLISIISTVLSSIGLIDCTGFLLRGLVLECPRVPIAKSTVSIKSTGFRICRITDA